MSLIAGTWKLSWRWGGGTAMYLNSGSQCSWSPLSSTARHPCEGTIPPACCLCREPLGPPAPAFCLDGGQQDISHQDVLLLKVFRFQGGAWEERPEWICWAHRTTRIPRKRGDSCALPLCLLSSRGMAGGEVQALGWVCFQPLRALGEESIEDLQSKVSPSILFSLSCRELLGRLDPKATRSVPACQAGHK